MMTEESTTQEGRSTLAKPWFIGSAVVVGLIVVAGIIVATTGGGEPEAGPTPTAPAASPSVSEQAPAGDASVCGLPGVEMSGRVTSAPDATWEYQDVYAYPTSPSAGPGATAPEGYRYCFQHSPNGALFAAAYAAVSGSVDDPDFVHAWLDYALAEGAQREDLLAGAAEAGADGSSQSARGSVAGFRLLSYDADSARVDIAFTVTASGQQVTISGVYELVWSEGDWKIDTDADQPIRTAQIPSTAGYVGWSEGNAGG
jgi:hypothetical protein